MGQRRLFRSCFSKESILRVEEKERHLIKMARFPNFLLLTVCSPLIFGKPQYGGAPVQTPVSAPVVQAPSQISCFTTQETIWDTQYIEKTESSSQQKTDCESRWEEDGYGGKKWVEVPSTCQQNNYDTCRDVQKQKLVQVPYTDCKNVPQQECKKVPQQECQQEPYTASQQVCEDVHRKIPQRVSRTVPKKTCGGGGGGSGGFLPERQTSGGGGGGYRSGSSSNELVFTGALGSNSGSNVKSAPQTRAGGDAINFG